MIKLGGLLVKKEVTIMKDTDYLINCARGPVVNERELIKALEEGLIAGAGIDVYKKRTLC